MRSASWHSDCTSNDDVRIDSGKGTVLESLSFKAGGEALNSSQPIVLSCGGIYMGERKIPTDFKSWQQIINLPGPELSAKIFGFSRNPGNMMKDILLKEVLN